jgi:hypothetical protein
MYTAIKLGQKVVKGALLGVFFGLTAHSKPSVAFPIMLAIIASQGLCLGLAAAYRPFISAFLNFLEVTCGALDVATLVTTAVVYQHKQAAEVAGLSSVQDQSLVKASMSPSAVILIAGAQLVLEVPGYSAAYCDRLSHECTECTSWTFQPPTCRIRIGQVHAASLNTAGRLLGPA